MLVCRGILSLFKRWLVVREHVSAEPDVLERTIETNRAIFWRRSLWLTALPAVYFALMYFIFGLAPLDAVLVLPSILQAFFGQMIYLVFLMFANFALILGPFYILSRIGKTMIVPDDARFGVDIEDVRGQKSAVRAMKRILKLIEVGRGNDGDDGRGHDGPEHASRLDGRHRQPRIDHPAAARTREPDPRRYVPAARHRIQRHQVEAANTSAESPELQHPLHRRDQPAVGARRSRNPTLPVRPPARVSPSGPRGAQG